MKHSGQFQKGNKVNLGRVQSPETILKISLASKGRPSWNKGLKGTTHALHSEETKRKMSLAHMGKKGYTAWNKGKEGLKGSLNPAWKGGITPSNKLERKRFRNTVLKLVLERDNYTCQLCGERGVDLQVDHIQSWAEYIELRFSMDNCRTLCAKCHYKITFGKTMPENIKTWGHTFGRRVLQ